MAIASIHSHRRTRAAALIFGAVASAVVLPTAPGRGAERSWDLAVPAGAWSAPASWALGQTPDVGDDVRLNSAAGPGPFAATFDLAGAPRYGAVRVQAGAPAGAGEFVLWLDAPALTLAAASLAVGVDGVGRVAHSTGNLDLTGNLALGEAAGGNGTYELSGTGALAIGGHLSVGGTGAGTFVQTGSAVNRVGGNLQIGVIVGEASRYVLAGADARLNVTGTERLFNGPGNSFAQTGGVHTAGALLIDDEYTVTGGTVAVAGTASIGRSGGSVFTLAGATLSVAGDDGLIIGDGGTGRLTVSNGASITGLKQFRLGLTRLNVLGGRGTVDHYDASVSVAARPGTSASLIVGGGGIAPSEYNLRPGGTLTVAGHEFIGPVQDGTFNQTGGVHTVAAGKWIYVGKDAGSGTYNLSGGTLRADVDFLGYDDSSAFNLSGEGSLISGTVRVRGVGSFNVSGPSTATLDVVNLFVGDSAATDGYTLPGYLNQSGGSVRVSNNFSMNRHGSVVRQTGGSMTVDKFLFVGASGGTARYELGGVGQLHARDQAFVGFQQPSDFVQAGGAFTADKELYVGTFTGGILTTSESKYALSAGTLLLPNSALILGYTNGARGAFEQSGGTATIKGFELGYQGTGRVQVTGGSLASEYVMAGSRPGAVSSVVQSGGTFAVGPGAFTLGYATNAATVYKLSGAGRLDVATTAYLGNYGAATFEQTGGEFNVTGPSGALFLGYSKGGSGNYTLSAGKLAVDLSMYVGYTGNGSFTQSGGTVDVGDFLFVADSSLSTASYAISAGTLAADQVEVGTFGIGTVTQTGGAVTVNTRLNLASGLSASRGTYNLSGATSTFAADSVVVGFGTGIGAINQSGGTFTAATTVHIGNAGSQTSSVTVTGGKFQAATLFVGFTSTANAVLTVNGGTVAATTALYAGVNDAAVGTVNVSSGHLSAPLLVLGKNGGGRGFVNQAGGELFANQLTVGGGATAPSAYAMSGGTLELTTADVGYGGRGTFDHSGGSVGVRTIFQPAGLSIGRLAGGYGTYTLRNTGVLDVHATTYVGDAGKGELFQTGGSFSTFDLFVGNAAGGSGQVSLAAGNFGVGDDEQVGVAGVGSLEQTGGTHSVARKLIVGSTSTAAGAAGTFALKGGALTVPAIEVHPNGAFHHTGGTLAASTLALLGGGGGGAVTLGGQQTWAAGATLTATGGTVALDSDAGGPAGVANLGVTATEAAVIAVNATQHLRGLSLSTGAKATVGNGAMIVTPDLNVDATAHLDVGRGGVIVKAAAGLTTAADVRDLLVAGYAGGTWAGPGVASAAAAADLSTAVGYARAADVLAPGALSFMGEPIDAADDAVLVRFTLAADADLDGVVDFNDLVRLAQNYNQPAGEWSLGDFNYDGAVDFVDLVMLAQNYNAGLPVATGVAGAPAGFAGDLANAFAAAAAVPEPASTLILAPAAFAWATRRQRRRGRPVT